MRECFVPRPGHVFAAADYSSLELYTLAETCFELLGRSALGDVLNQGLDPHTALAADIMRIDYDAALVLKKSKDKAFDDARQTAKVANFGFPGGLGPASLVGFARATYGVILTEPRARQLKNEWLRRWPEMRAYFEHVNIIRDVDQLYVGRVRGGAPYTARCNSYFQGLGADVAKNALWRVVRACYARPDHVLYGCRAVNFVHDEIIMEIPDDERVHERAMALSDEMVLGAKDLLKHVCPKAEPVLMNRWSKNAESKKVDGRLQVWRA